MTTQQTTTAAGRTLLRAAVRLTLPLCALSLMTSPALGYSPDTNRLAGTNVIPMSTPHIGPLAGTAHPLRMQLATEYTLEQQLKRLSRYYQQHPNVQPPKHLVPLLQDYRARTAAWQRPPSPRVPPSRPPVYPGGTRANLPAPVFPTGTRANLPPTPVQPAVRQFLPVPQRFQQPSRAAQPAQVAPVAPQTRRAALAPAIAQPVRSRAVAPAPVATPPTIPSNPTGAVYSPGSSTGGSNVAQQTAVQQGARNLGDLKRDMDARKAAGK